jgi:hypothetical protein
MRRLVPTFIAFWMIPSAYGGFLGASYSGIGSQSEGVPVDTRIEEPTLFGMVNGRGKIVQHPSDAQTRCMQQQKNEFDQAIPNYPNLSILKTIQARINFRLTDFHDTLIPIQGNASTSVYVDDDGLLILSTETQVDKDGKCQVSSSKEVTDAINQFASTQKPSKVLSALSNGMKAIDEIGENKPLDPAKSSQLDRKPAEASGGVPDITASQKLVAPID